MIKNHMKSLLIRTSLYGTFEGIGIGWLLASAFHSPKFYPFEITIALLIIAIGQYLLSRLITKKRSEPTHEREPRPDIS
jgi:hypothetical protein